MRVLCLLLVLLQGTTFNDPGFDQGWSDQVKFSQAYTWYQSHGPGLLSRMMVVDGWIDCTHPELSRACSQAGSVPGEPFNFVTSEPVYQQTGFDHGSHVTSAALAEVSNSIGALGIAGFSTAVGLVRAKGIRSNGNVDVPAVRASWQQAALIPNLTVISNSISLLNDDDADQLLTQLENHGTDVVIGSGEEGVNLNNNAQIVAFKARHKNLIVVGGTSGDNLSGNANYGDRVVDIVAPAQMNVLSMNGNRQGFSVGGGQSYSIPQVAGALALIRSYQPDPVKARLSLLLGAAKNQRSPLVGKVAYGVLDIFDSLQMLDPPTGLTLLPREDTISRAAAVGSVIQVAEPLSLRSPVNFGNDGVTRVAVFAINWPTNSGTAPTAEAKVVSSGQTFPLTVEDVRAVPTHPWLTQATVRLNSNIPVPGDVEITVNAGGNLSNPLKLALKQ